MSNSVQFFQEYIACLLHMPLHSLYIIIYYYIFNQTLNIKSNKKTIMNLTTKYKQQVVAGYYDLSLHALTSTAICASPQFYRDLLQHLFNSSYTKFQGDWGIIFKIARLNTNMGMSYSRPINYT